MVKSFRKNGDLLSVDEERCKYIRGVSLGLWKILLAEPGLISARLNPEHYRYSPDNYSGISADFISYKPVR